MLRRSRFSVRPNVGGPGRTASQEASQPPKDISDSVPGSAVPDMPVDAPGAAPTASGDGNDPSGEGNTSSTAVQRRKRFSVKPRVAPGRPSTLPRVSKSPTKVVSESPAKVSELESTTSNEVKTPSPQKPSADSKPPHARTTAVSSEGCGDTPKETHPLSVGGKKTADCLIKVPPRPPDKVSLPDRESAELSEKAKTLLSSKGRTSIPRFSLSRLLNDPSDIQRLEKAQKLRDLLRQEMRKEKGIRRTKKRIQEFSMDPTKMTMRDLIRYLPLSNPMSPILEDSTQENETATEFCPRLEVLPERAGKPEPEVVPKMGNQMEEDEEEGEEPEQEAGQEEEEDEALMVPRVKVAEDGTLILDEESLTVEVQRAKGPNPNEDRDPIFERGSTTTYSSFRASTYCKPWSSEETDMFFLAISMVGTDFSMICQLFPNRTRSEIRNKFKKEERQNSWRVDKAFQDRRKLDIEYFSKLLQKILEFQESRKKLKSLVEKSAPKKRQRKSKGTKRKNASTKLSGSDDEEELDEDVLLSSEAEDGEKENELREEGETSISKAKRKRKLRREENVSAAKPSKRKSKTDEACIPKDTEAALPEDLPDPDMYESAETKKKAIQPPKLSRGRAAQPAMPPGREWSTKPPPPSTTAAEDGAAASAKEDDTWKDQANRETSPSLEASENDDDDSSGDEDYPIKPAKPTRYGRVPKPTALLNYPAKDASHSTPPELQPKSTPERSRTAEAPSATPASKKLKLGLLRASQSEPGREEDDNTDEQGSSNSGARGESSTQVPANLCSPHAAIPQEEEEIVEELDIFADMSVLDMSQDALCLNSSCKRAQIEAGSREPCVHQLDLLVDVIDFLSSEQPEVSEAQSYNEAAQTLLTIGNVSHLSPSDTTQDENTGILLDVGNETCQRLEEEIVAELVEENSFRPVLSVYLDQKATDTFHTALVEPANTQSSPQIGEETGQEQRPVPGPNSTVPLQSNPQTSKAHLYMMKPKPDQARASRAAHSKSQPETSPPWSTVESQSAAPEEPTPNIAEYSQSSEKQTCDLVQATMEAMGTDAETTQSGQSHEGTSAPAEPLAQESDRGQDAMPQNSSQLSSFQPIRRSPLQKMKPKPSIPQISKCQTTTETSLSSNMESTSEMQPQPNCTSYPASDGTPTMNLSSTLVSTEELTCSDVMKTSTGLVDQVSQPKPTDAEKIECGPNNEAVTEPLAQQSNTPFVQGGGAHDIMPDADVHGCLNSRELPSSQKGGDNDIMPKVHEHQSSSKPLSSPATRSRFQRVKPKPNLSQISKSTRSKPPATEDTSQFSLLKSACTITTEVDPHPTSTFFSGETSPSAGSASYGTPTMNLSSTVVSTEELTFHAMKSTGLADQDSEGKPTDAEKIECGPNKEAVTEPLAQQSSTSLVQEGGDPDTVPEADVHRCLNSSELPSSQATRSRFRRVKPKPNLLQVSKCTRSKPQTTDTSQSSRLDSTSKTTAEVEPKLTCTSPSDGSASDGTPTMNVCSTLESTEELTCSAVMNTSTGLADQDSEGKPTDAEKIECGPNKEAVTEPLAQQSSTPLVQEGGDHDTIPEANLKECQNSSKLPSSRPTRRTGFQKVKPKPNLPPISKSRQSKPQTTKEMLLSANMESSRKTSGVEPLPTSTFSTEKPSQRAPAVTPSIGLSTRVVPAEETSRQGKEAGVVKLADPVEPRLPTLDSGKENLGIKKATFGAAAETLSLNAEITQTSSKNVVPSKVGPDCQVGAGAHAKQAAAQQASKLMEKSSNFAESSDHPSIEARSPKCQSVTSPLEPREHPCLSGDNNKEVVSEASKYTAETTQRRRRLPKVKPNLRSPTRAIPSVSQSQDGGESPKQPSHRRSHYGLVEEKSHLQSGNAEGVAMESKNPAGKEPEICTALCQDKTEGGTSLKLDGQIIPAFPSNIQPIGQETVLESSQSNQMTTNTHPLECAEDPPLPKTATNKSGKPSLGKTGPHPRQEDSDADSTAAAQEHAPDLVMPAEGAMELLAHEDESALRTAQNQTFASFSIFPDTLSVPSDPDEPFFILSLTEIPVVSSGEVLDAISQPPSLLPEAQPSVQQSLADDEVVAGHDAPIPDVLVSSEETGTTVSPAMEEPVAPPECKQACTSADPLRAASSPKRKPKGFLSFLSGTSSTAESNKSTSGKAASRRPTVKALHGRRPTRHNNPPTTSTSSQAPVETTPPEPQAPVDTTPPEPQAPMDTMLPEPQVAPRAAEVSASQHRSSTAVQEEPTDVSQYFLSDIFTEVQDT